MNDRHKSPASLDQVFVSWTTWCNNASSTHMTVSFTTAASWCRAGSGVLVALGADISGRVPLTELHDALVPNAVEGLKPGQAVRASVLQAANSTGPSKKAGRHQLLLSLRPSKGGAVAGLKRPKAAVSADAAIPVNLQATDLSANQQVSPCQMLKSSCTACYCKLSGAGLSLVLKGSTFLLRSGLASLVAPCTQCFLACESRPGKIHLHHCALHALGAEPFSRPLLWRSPRPQLITALQDACLHGGSIHGVKSRHVLLRLTFLLPALETQMQIVQPCQQSVQC